jgi:GTPase
VKNKKKKPAWSPEQDAEAFATSVVEGVSGSHDGLKKQTDEGLDDHDTRRKKLGVDDYVEGVLQGDRMILARTITLIESNARKHQETAQEVLKKLLPHTGSAIRIGITGVPGAGKSTFINTLGSLLCGKGRKLAVLAVDPSSSLSKGSILGDKTRMDRLSQEKNCFIRPTPSGGTLGGVSRKTRETMLICEAAGFDTIFVETVGVGQSEALVSTMVDFFLLLTLTGAGDELQSIKKGVIELADTILINKADGDNKLAAQRTRQEINQALHLLNQSTEYWETQAHCCSSITGEGVEEIWELILEYENQARSSGSFQGKRQEQTLNWMHDMIREEISDSFFQNPAIRDLLPRLEKEVISGQTPVTTAVARVLTQFRDLREEKNRL